MRLQVIEGSEIEPAPITPTEGAAWQLMSGTTRHIWQDAIVSPSGMVGELAVDLLFFTREGFTDEFDIVCSQHGHEGTAEALARRWSP